MRRTRLFSGRASTAGENICKAGFDADSDITESEETVKAIQVFIKEMAGLGSKKG